MAGQVQVTEQEQAGEGKSGFRSQAEWESFAVQIVKKGSNKEHETD